MPAVATRERRASPRIRSKQHVFIYDPADALEEVYGGWIVDRSRGGVCLALARGDIEEGSLLVVRPTPSTSHALGVTLMVKNRRVVEGGVYLGCEFTRR
jgi:hypothetical protein